jgi:hypothetical protein
MAISVGSSTGMGGEALAPTYTNRFTVRVGPEVTRITFGEVVEGVEATAHTAVVMLTRDASELASLIRTLIDQNQKLSPKQT